MSELAGAIDRRLRALGADQIQIGTVESITTPLTGPGRVLVSGLADQAVPCDWSSAFAAEIAAGSYLLIGRRVEVHFVDGQPIVAYSITVGEK